MHECITDQLTDRFRAELTRRINVHRVLNTRYVSTILFASQTKTHWPYAIVHVLDISTQDFCQVPASSASVVKGSHFIFAAMQKFYSSF